MELWIRTQSKLSLIKVDHLLIDNRLEKIIIKSGEWRLGIYDTKERAFEILDEIQSKLNQQFIVKADDIISYKRIDQEEIRLKYKYNKEFIMEDSGFEIMPINSNVIIYEMPKE